MNLTQELKKYFGYTAFRGNQEQIIKSIIAGDNVFVLMPTGAGKSLCYQLPALLLPGVSIVVSPLISLMKDQVDSLSEYADYINSSLSNSSLVKVRSRLSSGKTKLLYIAPESLHKVIDYNIDISFVAIDEAHCISEYGHDFRPKYREILKYVKGFPIVALTATATNRVLNDILDVLGIPNAKIFRSSFDRSNLHYEVRYKTKDIDEDILLYLRQHVGESGLVYCYSRSDVDRLTNFLVSNGISALPYHAGLSKEQRTDYQNQFMNSKVSVIVATNAFGMGINKSNIRFVIHYSVPTSIESYYQETGRAGRDGLTSQCILFYSYSDVLKYQSMFKKYGFSQRNLSTRLLSHVIEYCETSLSHREYILRYFGEIA